MRSEAWPIRLEANLSREVVAARAGTALETVRRLDRGEVASMKIETVLRLAAAIGVPPVELLPDLGAVVGPERVPPRRRRVVRATRRDPRPW
ncbi:helix-turn-helix transcriptional regulator [Myxococcota bacterium]|nr:helix-turn-helix transcriptional regulator [Myxococcota bacterium]